MNYLLAAVEWNIEWSDVADAVYVVVGAILGVLSSLFISWCAKRYGICRLKKMLRMELAGIQQVVEANITSSSEIILTSPIWNFLGQTSTLLDLNEKDYRKVVAIHGAILIFKANEQDASKRGQFTRSEFLNTIRDNLF